MTETEILIVEDEILTSETIKLYLEEFEYRVKDFAISYDEAIKSIEKSSRKPDLILLDIRLYGEKSGIDVVEYLNKAAYNIPYVFLTSQFDKQLIAKVLETNPSGYLIKPIQKESLITTVALALSDKDSSKTPNSGKIKIKEGRMNHIIDVGEISHIESDHIYCKIYLKDNVIIHSRNTLTNLEEDFRFSEIIQCHRSFLVNLNFVKSYDGSKLTLLNGKTLPLSKSYRDKIYQKLG